MHHNILLTGVSGYLGGTLLANLATAALPPYSQVFALVRSDSQAEAVLASSNATPLVFDVGDAAAVRDAVTGNDITIVVFCIDAIKSVTQSYMIKALSEVKERTGKDVHFIHTSGAKLFSSHAGAPTNRTLMDDETGIHEIHKTQRAVIPAVQPAIETNITVVELAERLGVYAYVFVPCVVYGEGSGFGNHISIQTAAICRAAKAVRRVHSVDAGNPTWPVSHITDTTNLYISILHAILSGPQTLPPHGRSGYYLAASGSVAWLDLYAAMARALARRGIVDDDKVVPATPETIERMATALQCPVEVVALQIGGCCTFTARNGSNIGWKPVYEPEHVLEAATKEVDLVLANWKG
ncbi:uncharacterized protein HMPREF1541_07043 [Cyphellophora europaea CBS 101466]|uniref:NAD(P)-binding domain-containing protein n=1 Tax=Cyphellophora europaea (strain CBS 101466) TaxID=1220924 RepID=W2RR65_CYPE1|nr:uncharacterized protein HMPREF1541_07043 [Cyphellophora europaea CBS 101466]ETN39001.1 hypothetical protein HMPREF1541_07043 [Cyphellophora europaea CBS 101466]